MKKILLLIATFTIIVSCRTVQDKFLYDENDDGYNVLVRQAAEECLKNNDIFDNLKASSFANYDILSKESNGDDNYIKLNDDTYIWINSVTTSPEVVTFTVISEETDSFKELLFQQTYSITLEQNNAIIDMIATGVCNGGDYEGSPSSSDSSLSFTVHNYNVKDGSAVTSTDTPDDYEEREDKFTMSTSYPAFLFLWSGAYQTYEKDEEETARQATSTISELELTITDSNLSACEEKFGENDECENIGVIQTLTIDSNAFNNTRLQNNDDLLKTYYFNEIKP